MCKIATVCFCLAALLLSAKLSWADDDSSQFVSNVENCLQNYQTVDKKHHPPTEDQRKDCLKGAATVYVYGAYESAASLRLFADFDDDYPALDQSRGNWRLVVAAKHWKDYPRPGPESREYMLQLVTPHTGNMSSVKIVARLVRSRGDAIAIQVARFLDGRFNLERDIEPLYPLKPSAFYAELKKKMPPVEAFMAVFAVEELMTDSTACNALEGVMAHLRRVAVPLPSQLRPPPEEESTVIEHLVLHPHMVVLRAPEYPILLTIKDASMDTDVYRWVTTSAQALESCWRHATKKSATTQP